MGHGGSVRCVLGKEGGQGKRAVVAHSLHCVWALGEWRGLGDGVYRWVLCRGDSG
jgi:hypothetical protein